MEKEKYLTVKNLREKVLEWKKELLKIRKYQSFSFNLKESALLVLDMQNVFGLSESHAYIPSIRPIISKIKILIQFFHHYNRKIIFTRHITKIDENDPMLKWWKTPILKNNIESQILEGMQINHGIIIEKHQYSAFFETSLESILKKNNIKQLVVSGVMTHLCCESTIRDGFMKGFNFILAMDATASYIEEFHLGSMKAISHGFGICLTSNEIIELYNYER